MVLRLEEKNTSGVDGELRISTTVFVFVLLQFTQSINALWATIFTLYDTHSEALWIDVKISKSTPGLLIRLLGSHFSRSKQATELRQCYVTASACLAGGNTGDFDGPTFMSRDVKPSNWNRKMYLIWFFLYIFYSSNCASSINTDSWLSSQHTVVIWLHCTWC